MRQVQIRLPRDLARQGTAFTRDGATVITVDYANRTWDCGVYKLDGR